MSRGSKSIVVHHRQGRYSVAIGEGLLETLEARVAKLTGRRRLAVITDRNVADAVPIELDAEVFVVPAGEASKSRAVWAGLTDKLLERRFGRDSAIIAIGGGVIGDLAGFVAATYLRGIPHVQVPTSLLAMVDSSVGGKTGINAPAGKNLIGAFHPPLAVFTDPMVLRTLPDPFYREGLVEALKHGIAADRRYFEWIESNAAAIDARDPGALASLVRRSVAIKAAIVSKDERETGRRAVLNAGHTIGHALESASGLRVSHGLAVAIGLLAETELSESMGLAPAGTAARIETLYSALGIKPRLPAGLRVRSLVEAMDRDKKAASGVTRFALPAGIGRIVRDGLAWTIPVPAAAVTDALGRLGKYARIPR